MRWARLLMTLFREDGLNKTLRMKYKTLNEYKEETHPWEPFIPNGADKLILGTFPTAEGNRGAYEFFYPNPQNDFWNILFKVVDKNLRDYNNEDPINARHEVLSELRLGIADIGKRVLRQKDSSKDVNLFPIEYRDIFHLLTTYPAIQKIIITSSSGGNSVLSWFHHYCSINGFRLNVPKVKLPISTELLFDNRILKIEIISSPSRLSPVKGDKLYQMYRNAILNN